MTQLLMPMATAVWLVDNSTLTFAQIAELCSIHELEVQGIADGTVGINIVGQDPTASGQVTKEELARCQDDPTASLKVEEDDVQVVSRTKGPRYTPVSKRQDKPDAIAWLVRNHAELSDLQISRLVGTTKPTIKAIRERSHWNIQNIHPHDPVGLGLCKQVELDEAVQLAAARRAKAGDPVTPPVVVESVQIMQPAPIAPPKPAAPKPPVREATGLAAAHALFNKPAKGDE